MTLGRELEEASGGVGGEGGKIGVCKSGSSSAGKSGLENLQWNSVKRPVKK